MRVILLFVDGLGIGGRRPMVNPLFAARLPALRALLEGEPFSRSRKRVTTNRIELFPVNATLGVPGLPQSGTGQTAIFTGVNGARIFGRHFGPYPPTALRPAIIEKNIFRRILDRGKTVCFANAFPRRFFDYTATGTRRLTVTTFSSLMAAMPLRGEPELLADQAISADFTREKWPELGHSAVRPISPSEAGRHLWNIAETYDFTLFEYWLTDHAGHSQNMDVAVNVLERLDEFLGAFFECFDDQRATFVLISDHGNLEDLSVKSHTRNAVPCLVAGRHRQALATTIRNLTHITPRLVDVVTEV